MPDNCIEKIKIINTILNHFGLNALGINFNDNKNWIVNCADGLGNNNLYVKMLFTFKENNFVWISIQKIYGIDKKSKYNKIKYRDEIARYFGKTLAFKSIPEMDGYYKLVCGNNGLACYSENFNGNFVEMPDTDIKSVRFTDANFGVQKNRVFNLD